MAGPGQQPPGPRHQSTAEEITHVADRIDRLHADGVLGFAILGPVNVPLALVVLKVVKQRPEADPMGERYPP
jgi:hypothetical protein